MTLAYHACDPVSHQGMTNTWFTPKWITDALGDFDLDPCSQTFRPHNTALHHVCEDSGEDGLLAEWHGRVWLNPPYGRDIHKWLSRLCEHGNGIALVFARTETQWGQYGIRTAHAVNFVKSRIRFLRSDGSEATNAGTGSMLLAYGKRNVDSLSRVDGVIF